MQPRIRPHDLPRQLLLSSTTSLSIVIQLRPLRIGPLRDASGSTSLFLLTLTAHELVYLHSHSIYFGLELVIVC